MKLITTLLALCLSASAWADSAQVCLEYGKQQMAENAEMHALLNAMRIEPDSVVENRYDANVGSQPVATELSAGLRSRQGEAATMLCLLNNDRPLYVYFDTRK